MIYLRLWPKPQQSGLYCLSNISASKCTRFEWTPLCWFILLRVYILRLWHESGPDLIQVGRPVLGMTWCFSVASVMCLFLNLYLYFVCSLPKCVFDHKVYICLNVLAASNVLFLQQLNTFAIFGFQGETLSLLLYLDVYIQETVITRKKLLIYR